MMPGCVPEAGEDLPDPMGVDGDCDGVDGVAAISVFVTLGGDDTKSGTRVAPVASLDRAYEIAAEEGLTTILLGAGVYERPLQLERGVNVHGGYVDLGNGWWTRNGRTVFEAASPALVAEQIDEPTHVSRVEIIAKDAEPGESSIAARVVDVEELTLEDVILQAGRGGDGVDGVAPEAPARAADGAPGQAADHDGSTYCNAFGGLPGFVPAGGEGGDGEGRRGGSGGDGGGLFFASTDLAVGHDGELGDGDPAGMGPAGGYRTPTMSAPRGEGGWSGPDGAPGAPGPLSYLFDLDASGLHPGRGGDGRVGGDGAGGAGGGGGALQGIRILCPITGGGGGGGGAGGLGGEGGEGGVGGGLSVALMLWRSSPSLRRVYLSTAAGGEGGAGATGAAGGEGGSGGLGGTALTVPEPLVMIYYDDQGIPYFDYSVVTDPSHGGDGGDGGRGEAGGGGAGGAGGSSLAIVRDPSSAPTLEQSFIDLAQASSGVGGSGGVGASSGPPGRVGEMATVGPGASVTIGPAPL